MKRWAAIVLAAGQSSRFGADDKLQADLHGKPVIEHVLDALDCLSLDQTIIVVRPGMTVHNRTGTVVVTNPLPDRGMGESLSLGAKALEPCHGVLVVLGDMPMIDITMLYEMQLLLEGHDIVAPDYAGRSGHPVLFGPACFDELRDCNADRGARHLLASPHYLKVSYPVTKPETQLDIDTFDDLTNLRRMKRP